MSTSTMSAIAAPTLATPANLASTHPFTCNTCQVAFRGSDLQRGHMQSDWHRYNLKRRVASLPPLTSEVFTEKVLANKASAAATAARASFERVCGPCERTYFSENAYQNHLGSQKHKIKVIQLAQNGSTFEEETNSMISSVFSLKDTEDDVDIPTEDQAIEEEFSEVVDAVKNASIEDIDRTPRPSRPHHSVAEDREPHPLSPEKTRLTPFATHTAATVASDDSPITTCLFCSARSSSIDENVMHMAVTHSLFIPEREYLVDLEGLLGFLYDKVATLHECLYCGQLKHTTHGIKTHMRDKGHCMIAFDEEVDMIEVGQFYDFRSTYSDDESEDEEEDPRNVVQSGSSGTKLGMTRKPKLEVEDEDEEMDEREEGGWETDDTDLTEEESDKNKQNNDNVSQSTSTRVKKPSAHAYYDEYELHLPSGRTAGHRSLAKYYRQNLREYPSATEREAQRAAITEGSIEDVDDEGDGTSVARVSRGRQQVQSRANGGLGMLGVADAQKAAVHRQENQDRKRTQRVQNRYQWGNEKRANMQKHYRDPLLQ